MFDPKVSVVLPVYNQADHIREVVGEYREALETLKHPIEMLLVINGCRDNSLEVCSELAEQFRGVRVLESERAGWGTAVRTGLEAADGDILCYTNSARTSAQVLALHLIVALSNPNLVIKANRRFRTPFTRRVGSVLYNMQCRQLFNLPHWDVNGTPKAFSREAFERLDLREEGDLIDLEFVIKCLHNDLQILEVPVVQSDRHGGDSTTNYTSAAKIYWGVFRMWQHYNNSGKAR